MASTSFYRRAAVPSSRALQFSVRSPSILIRPAQATYTRQFSLSSRCTKEYPEKLSTNESTKTDQYPDDEHSTKKAHKGDDFDVQTSNVKGGMDSAKKSSTGGHATEGRDSAGGVEKAKKEHPEAPDPAIGMQDERGGRGG